MSKETLSNVGIETDAKGMWEITEPNKCEQCGVTYAAVVAAAAARRTEMEKEVHPKPSIGGAGTCTAGLPSTSRQPCCLGCKARGLLHFKCVDESAGGGECSCEDGERHDDGGFS